MTATKLYAAIASWAEDDGSVNLTNRILINECVKQRKKDGKYVSEPLTNHLKSTLISVKRMDEIRPSYFSIYSIVSRSLIAPAKRKLHHDYMKNRVDSL